MKDDDTSQEFHFLHDTWLHPGTETQPTTKDMAAIIPDCTPLQGEKGIHFLHIKTIQYNSCVQMMQIPLPGTICGPFGHRYAILHIECHIFFAIDRSHLEIGLLSLKQRRQMELLRLMYIISKRERYIKRLLRETRGASKIVFNMMSKGTASKKLFKASKPAV